MPGGSAKPSHRVFRQPVMIPVFGQRGVPVDAVVLIVVWITHHDAGSSAMSGVATASYGGHLVDVGGGIRDHAGKVLCEKPCARWYVRHGAGRRQIVTQIYDPGITHTRTRTRSRSGCGERQQCFEQQLSRLLGLSLQP